MIKIMKTEIIIAMDLEPALCMDRVEELPDHQKKNLRDVQATPLTQIIPKEIKFVMINKPALRMDGVDDQDEDWNDI